MWRTRLYILFILVVLALVSWVFYMYWYLPSHTDDSSFLIKSASPLSNESRARIPDGFPYLYITGTDIQITDGGFDNGSYWITTQVSDDASMIVGKYRYFFQKTNWTTDTDMVAQQTAQISVHKNDRQFMVTATNLPTGGSIARLVYTGPAWMTETTPTP